ncbi:GNAT family N-acetyltransferase [Sphingomonas sp. S1-29]|uniref:GNAT family N-acetyltransferase n=1 Tax=Sphingomonas sp. S1-29 TaxID=2991074 RepID=UPI00224034AD|nr:GNAT family N-acetyltransferase [Sphingomonas sp. S1-29]UZK69705.1 GNAT family N-acetyltransferase [Sphingomonas sp. S1-29]
MIETERLRLRPWREADKPGFAAIINTPAMMAHFGGVQPRAKIDAIIDREIANQARDGHCMWAVETQGGEVAGVCGVRCSGYPGTPVPDVLEIGWRIGEAHWGQGIAREAAEASIAWAWANTQRTSIAAWTSAGNDRSWGLMRRLGMARRADLDFQHPNYPGDPIGAMIVYAIDRDR